MQVASSFSRYKDCNGSCVDKSFFCPPKDVCESPNFVCFGQCLPAYYRQWYQVLYELVYVRFCPPKDVCESPNFVCFGQCLPAYYRQWYQVLYELVYVLFCPLKEP
jgi:hypothetical protein